jgi:predicted nucleic acid-binding protein
VDAFDADVLIYAAAPEHALGRRVARLFRDADGPAGSEPRAAGVGSVLLVPELLAKPMRDGRDDEVDALSFFLARLELLPIDRATADLSAVLAVAYALKPIDAAHLAAAVGAGADRFITNNRRDFDRARIREIDVTYPDDLPPAPARRR